VNALCIAVTYFVGRAQNINGVTVDSCSIWRWVLYHRMGIERCTAKGWLVACCLYVSLFLWRM